MVPNKFALLSSVFLLATSPDCTTTGGVALRADGTPGPEECPEEARKAMKYMRMFVGDATVVTLDANQSSVSPITLYEGPIESVLEEALGVIDSPARLYGRVWTGGPQVVIRYYAAHPLDGSETVPICAVARVDRGQLRKLPESKPGTAVLEFPRAAVYIVDAFR